MKQCVLKGLIQPSRPPLVVSCGLGVNSVALLVGLARNNVRPDRIVFADTGAERVGTYAYRPILRDWLAKVGFPDLEEVRYIPQRLKNWPPYHDLEGNCLTNGTLPSISFGRKACSMKWKIEPIDSVVEGWHRAQESWASGERVTRLIGYDAGPQDVRRRNHAGLSSDSRFTYLYPLQDWEWDRKVCQDKIADAGLPIPPKSSCFFCMAVKPEELSDYSPDLLRRIVAIEWRAKPRLRTVAGLWRKSAMTDFIRQNGLLSELEILEVQENTPQEVVPAKGLVEEFELELC